MPVNLAWIDLNYVARPDAPAVSASASDEVSDAEYGAVLTTEGASGSPD